MDGLVGPFFFGNPNNRSWRPTYYPVINPFLLPDNPINKNQNNSNNDGQQAAASTELDLYDDAAKRDDGRHQVSNPAVNLNHLEHCSKQVEDAINHLSNGGGLNEFLQTNELFLRFSTYSPLRLTHELGWEPTPRSRQHFSSSSSSSSSSQSLVTRFNHAGPKGTWIDAFEDLMRVSTGLEMFDLSAREEEAKEEDEEERWGVMRRGGSAWTWGAPFSSFPSSSSSSSSSSAWFKMNSALARMYRNGSMQGYIPMFDTPKTMEEWVKVRQRWHPSLPSSSEMGIDERRRNKKKKKVEEEIDEVVETGLGALGELVKEGMRMFDEVLEPPPREEIDKFFEQVKKGAEEGGDVVVGLIKDLAGMVDAARKLSEASRGGVGSLGEEAKRVEEEAKRMMTALSGGRTGMMGLKDVKFGEEKVTTETDDRSGMVKETVTRDIYDSDGKVIGKQVSSVWKSRGGRVVESQRTISSVLESEKSIGQEGTADDSAVAPGAEEEDLQKKRKESRYKKWSLWSDK